MVKTLNEKIQNKNQVKNGLNKISQAKFWTESNKFRQRRRPDY